MDEKRKQLAQEWFSAAQLLKVFLILHGSEPPRTHDLTKLLDASIEYAPQLIELRNACELLNSFYIEVRYPPDIPELSKSEIQQSYEAATIIKETIERYS